MLYDDDEERYDIASNNAWFQSCFLPSNLTSQSIMALPEMPLQHSVSNDTEFLNLHDENVTQNQRYSSGNEKDTQLKRSRRHEVHNRSEKKRRSRINGKLKTLQELMPHCKKKDRASVLDEAANCIRLLQRQVEALSKLGEVHHVAQSQYMPCSVNPGLQYSYAPMQQGAGMCVGCYARLPPFFQLPSPSSTAASFRDPRTCPMNGD